MRFLYALLLLLLLLVAVKTTHAYILGLQSCPVKFAVQRRWRPDDDVSTRISSSSRLEAHRRGDARGAALLVENVSVYRGPVEILSDIHWRVEPMAKWALVGSNGCGKSSLLKAITNELSCNGDITLSTTAQVGYLQQTALEGSNRTIYEEAASAMKEIEEARSALEQAQGLVENDASTRNIERLDVAQANYERVGGYTQEQKVASVLKGLGFVDLYQRCNELSGGWQMRVALARLLLSSPSLLVLDEPSNHLDVNARQWLGSYLKNYDAGAMILVTHDVSLLHSVSHIGEIAGGTLEQYKSCTYSQYLEEKRRRADAAAAEYERNSVKAAKLQGFVDRFGASANRASQAQSRVKQLDKMQRQGLLEAPIMTHATRFQPTLSLPEPPRAIGNTLLELQNATIGWNNAATTSPQPLVQNVNLKITKGMKLWIRGPNGAGKSTILAALRNVSDVVLIHGTRIENDSLRLGVFTQDLAQELDPTKRAVDLVLQYARQGEDGNVQVKEQDARSCMGRLGLSDDKALRRILDLSGGEKARVALSMFALKANNCILLDEPSNHLDVECVQALSQALAKWDSSHGSNNSNQHGALVVVSHDYNFLKDILFTHVGTVQDKRLIVEERRVRESDWNMFDEQEPKSTSTSIQNDSPNKARASSSSSTTTLDRKLQKQAYNAPKRIEKLGHLIQECEKQVALMEEQMIQNGSNVKQLMELTRNKQSLENQISNYLQEWQELEDLVSSIS